MRSKRSVAYINLLTIKNNLERYVNTINEKKNIMAVVKADAYGHGDCVVANYL